MTDSLFEAVAHATRELTKYGFSTQEFAMLVQQHNMTDAEALAVAKVFDYLLEKRERSTVDFLLRTSHLPLKVPKTFDNFDFSRVTGKNVDKLRSLPHAVCPLCSQKPCLYWTAWYGQDPSGPGFWAYLL